MPDPSLRSACQIVAAYVTEQIVEGQMAWGRAPRTVGIRGHYIKRIDGRVTASLESSNG
jgi:hypothetical protein